MLQGCCRVGWTWQALVWLQKKDMNLSSCVTDSLLLSLDSAGQTLGTGTNPPPLSSLQPFVAKPDELGTLGEGERATELWERLQGFTMEGAEGPSRKHFSSSFPGGHRWVWRHCQRQVGL